MPYSIIEKSGCGIHKNRAKLRLDLLMNPDDPHYDKHHVYVPVIPEGGYPGKVDKEGSPVDLVDYQKWEDSLPHIWQNNPFHCHFIYPERDTTDESIKQEIERCLDYFYAFHKACWDADKEFIDEWKKVPSKAGDVRCPFVRGDPKDLEVNQLKVADILSRVDEFQIASAVSGDFELPQGKGTITIGNTASNRNYRIWNGYTYIDHMNAADGTGTIDTFEMWFDTSYENATGVKAGTFYGSDTDYTGRDYENIGDVTAGSKQPFSGLNCGVTSGDWAGIYASSGRLEADTAGTSYFKSGDQFGAGQQTYSLNAVTISLYGTGGIERQSPDVLIVQTNLTGSVTDIQDDPDSPDANWLTAITEGDDTVCHVSFPTPTGNPTVGAGLQEFKIWVRQTPGSAKDPNVRIELYEDGGQLAVIMADTKVTSETGVLHSATWNANLLANTDGSLVECYIYGTGVAAGPNKGTLEVGAVEWNVDYTTGPTPNAYNKILYTSEPPTPNAWNQVKQEVGTGWRKLEYS